VLLPLVALGIYALFFVAPLLDPGRANYPRFRGVFLVLRATILGVLVVLHMALIASAVQPSLHPGRAMAPVMGSLFVVIGLTLGKVRPNWFVGIRTPWTLSSKRSWTRSHRLGGWLFLCTGLATLLAWLVVPGIALIVLIAAGAATALSASRRPGPRRARTAEPSGQHVVDAFLLGARARSHQAQTGIVRAHGQKTTSTAFERPTPVPSTCAGSRNQYW
jgi:uncharacterized membrane protein